MLTFIKVYNITFSTTLRLYCILHIRFLQLVEKFISTQSDIYKSPSENFLFSTRNNFVKFLKFVGRYISYHRNWIQYGVIMIKDHISIVLWIKEKYLMWLKRIHNLIIKIYNIVIIILFGSRSVKRANCLPDPGLKLCVL